MSWAELALDYEAYVGRAIPAAPHRKLCGARLPLGARAEVLCKAVGLAGRHLAAGKLLREQPVGRCRSLLPLGGRMSVACRRGPTLPSGMKSSSCCCAWLTTAVTRGSAASERTRVCGRPWGTASSWTTSPGRRRVGSPSCPIRGARRGRRPPASRWRRRSDTGCRGKGEARWAPYA